VIEPCQAEADQTEGTHPEPRAEAVAARHGEIIAELERLRESVSV